MNAATADDVELGVIGREAQAVRPQPLFERQHQIDTARGIDPVDVGGQHLLHRTDQPDAGMADARIAQAARIGGTVSIIRMAFGQVGAEQRIGEPDAAIPMRRDIVGRVQRLAVERIGDDGHRAVQLPAHHAAEIILRRKLTALEVKRIAVGGEGGLAHHRHLAVVPQIAIERVFLHVAEDQIEAHSGPGRAFQEVIAGGHPLDGGLADQETAEAGIDPDDIGIGRAGGRRARAEIAGWIGDHRAGGAQLRLGFLGPCQSGGQAGQGRGGAGQHQAAIEMCH